MLVPTGDESAFGVSSASPFSGSATSSPSILSSLSPDCSQGTVNLAELRDSTAGKKHEAVIPQATVAAAKAGLVIAAPENL